MLLLSLVIDFTTFLHANSFLRFHNQPSAVRSLPLGVASFLAPSTALLSERSQRYSPIKERRTPRLDRRLASVEKADESFALDDAQLAHITKRKVRKVVVRCDHKFTVYFLSFFYIPVSLFLVFLFIYYLKLSLVSFKT